MRLPLISVVQSSPVCFFQFRFPHRTAFRSSVTKLRISLIRPVSVSQLINQGKYADAMNLADKELAANPQNVNLRFLRGVIFMETKKNDEAKRVFEQLIREYPEIADSYNNLAVIYAGEGNLGRAQDLLERALMNNASSVTTYSNLGDIYAAKAADMYVKAARLAPKNGRLKEKAQIAQDLTIRTAP